MTSITDARCNTIAPFTSESMTTSQKSKPLHSNEVRDLDKTERLLQASNHAPSDTSLKVCKLFSEYKEAISERTRSLIGGEIYSLFKKDFLAISRRFPMNERDDIIAECGLILSRFLCGELINHGKPEQFRAAVNWRSANNAIDWMKVRSNTAKRFCISMDAKGDRWPPFSIQAKEHNTHVNGIEAERDVDSLLGHAEGFHLSDPVIDQTHLEIAIEQATKNSPPSAITCFYLTEMEDYTFRECAEILSIPYRTLASQVAAIKTKLKNIFYPELISSHNLQPAFA